MTLKWNKIRERNEYTQRNENKNKKKEAGKKTKMKIK
jgi:hypothetical protein